MRQVFTSRRLENVEGVAKLLEDAGVHVRIVNGRSYKGSHRHAFSYRDNARDTTPQAEVWITHSEDITHARQLLREAGLLDPAQTRFVPVTFHTRPAENRMQRTPGQRAMRWRILMLLACIAAIAVMIFHR